MAITRNIIQRSNRVKTYDYTTDIPPYISKGPAYDSRVTGYSYTDSLPVDSRPKPTNLLKSMTALPRRFKGRVQYAVSEQNIEYPSVGSGTAYKHWDFAVPITYTEPRWITDLRLEIQDTRVNLASATAEWKKTFLGFHQLALSLKNIKRNMLNPRSGKRRIDLCDISSSHLAIHYGIKPLVSDYAATLEKSRVGRPPSPQRIRSVSTERQKLSGYNYVGTVKSTVVASCYVMLEADTSPFDIGNPIEWGWELIPFSFVVDWALHVGDYLTAVSALSGVAVVSDISKVTRVKGRFATFAGHDDYGPFRNGFHNYESYEREVLGAIPMPEPPSWNPTDSKLVLAHAMALLNQLTACSGSRKTSSFLKSL